MVAIPLPDYYHILGVEEDASDVDITRAWRRLVLVSHPDKQGSSERDLGSPDADKDIRLINEARAVLSNALTRAEFDAQRKAAAIPAPAGPRIREYVSLEHFTPHMAENEEDEPERYTLPCRCGQEYEITLQDLEAGVDVIGCPGCGEYIGVEYEEIEE